MVDIYGFDKVKEFLLLVGKGHGYTLDYARKKVFSASFEEIEKEWRKYLKQKFLNIS